jgi:hypothetical protein
MVDGSIAQSLDRLWRARTVEVREIDQASYSRCQLRISHDPTVLVADATKPGTAAGFREENW